MLMEKKNWLKRNLPSQFSKTWDLIEMQKEVKGERENSPMMPRWLDNGENSSDWENGQKG